MEYSSEFERMVLNEQQSQAEDAETVAIQRWQRVFNLIPEDARQRIKEHRSNLDRSRISEEHWNLIRDKWIPIGHDKESYEYSLERDKLARRSPPKSSSYRTSEYLLKLDGPLNSATAVQTFAGLSDELPVFRGTNNSCEDASFVIVNGIVKELITRKLSGSFNPHFVYRPMAAKDLSASCLCPKLGIDFTLPQFKPHDAKSMLPHAMIPQQHDYPVWYFFYGTLGEPDRLTRLLDLAEPPTLDEAYVRGGGVKTWADTYRALVDGDRTDKVYGWAYLIHSKEQEDALRLYETDAYEVVRCTIQTKNGRRRGLTFQFVYPGRLR